MDGETALMTAAAAIAVDEQVHEGAVDVAVVVPVVDPQVPTEELFEALPVVALDAVSLHHLLHRLPEVLVRVSRLHRQQRHLLLLKRHVFVVVLALVRLATIFIRSHIRPGALVGEDGAGVAPARLEEEPALGAGTADEILDVVAVAVAAVVGQLGRGCGEARGLFRGGGGNREGGGVGGVEGGVDGLEDGVGVAEGEGAGLVAVRPRPGRRRVGDCVVVVVLGREGEEFHLSWLEPGFEVGFGFGFRWSLEGALDLPSSTPYDAGINGL